MNTPHGRPAARILRTRSNRARGVGVPGSRVACNSGSSNASETPRPTDTDEPAAASRSRSLDSTVPLVRIENGVPLSASARMTSGINWYRPSARWYGSVLVPIATCSRCHLGADSSLRNTMPMLIFTTICVSKSCPVSNSRYECVLRAKQ